eukprot:5536970-Pyramimonas_sp.AAC.1
MRDEVSQRFITDWDALLLYCREAPDPKILEPLYRTQIRRHAWMKQDMCEYQRMKISDPNRTYDWFRQRILDVLELKQLENNQNKLRYEHESRSQVYICAAWKKGSCRN